MVFWKLTSKLFSILFVASTATVVIADQDANWLDQTMTVSDARHLTSRTGFGASPSELLALVGLSRHEAIETIANGIKHSPHIPMPVWVDQPAPAFWKRLSLSADQQQVFDQDREREIAELRQWWVNNILQTDSPQTERLVLFWHDHFATSYYGVDRRSIGMARQNQTFRELGTGSYKTLLKAMIRDPALLIYLDNQYNSKGRPNENLARELLELFTLGEGNYDEATVKEAARALTGYAVSNTRNQLFEFQSYKHDTDNKTLFGVTADHNGDTLIDLILDQPAAAEFLVGKYWTAFVSDGEPDHEFVLELSNVFRQSDYDLFDLYKSVLRSQQFWDDRNRLSLIKSPATLLLGTARTLDYPKRAWPQLVSLQAVLGMELFSPPNVSGWKEGLAFVAPGRLLNRQLAIESLINTTATENLESESMMVKPTMMTDSLAADMLADSALKVRLAGHFYNGSPKFSVSLNRNENAEEHTLWVSDIQELSVGYDTEVFGPMRSNDLLPWINLPFSPPESALTKANSVSIEFHNDAADKTGDRNLFVESVTFNDRVIKAIDGSQESACVPEDKRYTGALYCAGKVTFEVNDRSFPPKARTQPYTATDAGVIWTTNNSEQKFHAIIALENVQTPNHFFHTLSFHLLSNDADSMDMRLTSSSCWPDCFEVWPECAWHDIDSDQRTLVFPLRRDRDAYINCHYNSLTGPQQGLINAVWKALPQILEHVATPELRKEHSHNIEQWQQRIKSQHAMHQESLYVRNAGLLNIDTHYEIPKVQAVSLPEPLIKTSNLTELEQLIKHSGLTLTDLLIGAGDVAKIPELSASSELPIQQQLQSIVTHPVFQAY